LDAHFTDTLIGLMAAWLLLAGVALWSHREGLGLSRPMLISSVRAPLQLLALALVLHWIFDIEAHWLQALLILAFCIMAAHNSASHFSEHHNKAWLASTIGLACGCAVTLPWLAFTGAIDNSTRALVPLGSMVAANGMNAVSIMFERMKSGNTVGEGLRTAMIPNVDTLRVVGLVHMPGIFVGMVLAGSPALVAAAAQLTILYMIVASSFTACMVSFLMLNHLRKSESDGGKPCG